MILFVKFKIDSTTFLFLVRSLTVLVSFGTISTTNSRNGDFSFDGKQFLPIKILSAELHAFMNMKKLAKRAFVKCVVVVIIVRKFAIRIDSFFILV